MLVLCDHAGQDDYCERCPHGVEHEPFSDDGHDPLCTEQEGCGSIGRLVRCIDHEMTEHTPGTWACFYESGAIHIRDSDGRWIAQLWDKFEGDFDNARANAHLIAVAPDLLAGCETFVDERNVQSHSDEFVIVSLAVEEWQAAKDAIAKARGEVQ